ncbi:hypothetical protein [Bdellovibrio sp.]|uniref:hypothetical protein n=1 Tax=Bdellovibrio sp. TaxID=28201 RepID=UPI0039E51812
MKIFLASLICSAFWSVTYAQNSSVEEKKPDSPASQGTSQNESEYQRPLLFAVTDDALKIKSPQLVYDLKKSEGAKLELGGVSFDDNSLAAKIENGSLNFSWDTNLISGGEISIINEQGKELWKHKAEGRGAWSFKDLKGSSAPEWKNGEHFRFCLRSDYERGYTSLCTRRYGIEVSNSEMKLGPAKSEATARVILQGEERKLQGAIDVTVGDPVQFLATLKSDATYEFVSEPVTPAIRDVIESERAGYVTLTGEGPLPLGIESKTIPGVQYGKITQFFGFEQTIGAPPDMWQSDFSRKGNLLLPGRSGGVFVYALEVGNPPRQKDRRYISNRAITGTYLEKDQMMVRDSEGNLSTWEFAAPEKLKMNTISLEVPGEKGTYKSYLEIYRGGAREASLRLTGVVTSSGDYVFLGEGHVSWWFNDLFGWQNYYLSKQRWGVSAKYFSSLTKLPASNSSGMNEDVNLNVAQADLRYRFNPGLWEKDETVGAILAYESMSLGTVSVPKLGVGAFWARSMPRAIDYWFSKLPFFDYPKFVDMEFISYVSSLDSGISLGSDYVLNFHGKVLWTQRIFGEAGFGLKNYYFEKKSDGSGAKLTTFFGTVGLGVNF